MTTGVAQSLGDRHRVAMPVRPALLQGDEGVNVMPAVGDRLAQTDDPVCLRAPFPVPVRVLDRAEGSLRLNEALVPMTTACAGKCATSSGMIVEKKP